MDPSSQATWLSAVPAIVLLAGLIVLPGWSVARALGMSSPDALGTAPAIGVFVLLASASMIERLGRDWTLLDGLAALGLVTAILVGAARLIRGSPAIREGLSIREGLALAGSVGIGAAVTTWQFVSGTKAPDALAQMPDAPFHLVAVKHLVDAQSASPWRSGEVYWYAPGSFYPGGFHSVAATTVSWAGVDVDVASHAALLAFTALFWPLSLILLARCIVQKSSGTFLAAGVLTLVTSYSTVAMMPVGAAWANAASASLLPAVLIPLVELAQAKTPPAPRKLAATVAVVTAMAAAAAMCQPNAVFGLAVLGLPIIGPRMVSWGWKWALVWFAAVCGAAAAWIVFFPPSSLDIPVDGGHDLRRAALLVLKGGDVPMAVGALVLLLTAIGLIRCMATLSTVGLVGAWFATMLLLLIVVFDTGMQVQRLAWPWYSGALRISVVWAIPAFLMPVCGFAWVERYLRARAAPLAAPAVAIGLVLLAVASMPAVREVRDTVQLGYYPADRDFTYVTKDEVKALQQLHAEAKPDGAIALDPFRGGMYLGMFGSRTLPVAPFSTTSKSELIDNSIDQAASDEQVCDAARKLGLTHVLTGGSRAKFYSSLDPEAPGIDAVPGAEEFSRVAAAGPYVLYQLPKQCQG